MVEWVKVPFNQARYGTNDCDGDGDDRLLANGVDSIVCSTVHALVRDAMAFWVQQQLDSGKTMAQIQAYLRTFDRWDRYDIDGDGNFDEPEGVIDHFQIVHSGGDEAAGDPTYGQDAIWSHRWATQLHTGCPYDPFGVRSVNIGQGGISDPNGPVPSTSRATRPGSASTTTRSSRRTAGSACSRTSTGTTSACPISTTPPGNTGGAENSTGFWTLMSSGANIGDGGRDGIGDDPVDLGAWEKWQLGWLNTEFVDADEGGTFELGPAEFNTTDLQGLVVNLPDKEVVTDLGDPFDGPTTTTPTPGTTSTTSCTRR